MNRQKAVARVAARVPAELRALRAKLVLEPLCDALGVEETLCPACRGSGWLDEHALTRCPLCLGFREVPVRLADWFEDEMLAARERRRRGCRGHNGAGIEPEDSRPPDPTDLEVLERWGRMAEQPYSVFLPIIE